ncbi:MAG: DUF4139 domain-containing protein [Rhodospirillales bacterium]|jgi:hypothetical protein|nr:DUF4139 domain-containing protein [Rhodospirillales bacterium]
MRRLAAALLAASTASAATAGEVDLPVGDRQALDVTIYAGGLALIRDSRKAVVTGGANRLAFPDVSRQLIVDSAVVSGEGLTVNALDYQGATLGADALVRSHVGHEVGVVRINPATGEETVERATILSADPGIVLRYRDRIETEVPGRLVFDAVPEDLRPASTLIATVHAEDASERPVGLAYLTTGLDWRADYVASLGEAGKSLTLTGRAIVSNASGADYAEARIGLVAGEISRASPPPAAQPRMRAEAMAARADAAPPEPDALGAVYLYSLPAPASLGNGQTRQFALLGLPDLAVEPRYVSESTAQVYGPWNGDPQPTHPRATLRFVNPKADAGGMPLAAGIVRIYTRDSGGVSRLLGEGRIADTPAGGAVTLEAGAAFDITVTRRQTDFARAELPEGTTDSAWRIELANAGGEAVAVDVVETIPGDWTVLSESANHDKVAAHRALWRVSVPAGGASALEYRVRVRQ